MTRTSSTEGRPSTPEEVTGPKQERGRTWPAVAALVAAGMLWGSSFVFGKIALASVGPAHLTWWRFLIASVVLMSLVGWRQRPRRRDLPMFLLAGTLNVPATFLVQFAGLQHTTASTAALIIGTLPPLVALAARTFLRERLGLRGWVAVMVSTTGIAVTVARPGGGNGWTGDALVFASLLAVWTCPSPRGRRSRCLVSAAARPAPFCGTPG